MAERRIYLYCCCYPPVTVPLLLSFIHLTVCLPLSLLPVVILAVDVCRMHRAFIFVAVVKTLFSDLIGSIKGLLLLLSFWIHREYVAVPPYMCSTVQITRILLKLDRTERRESHSKGSNFDP